MCLEYRYIYIFIIYVHTHTVHMSITGTSSLIVSQTVLFRHAECWHAALCWPLSWSNATLVFLLKAFRTDVHIESILPGIRRSRLGYKNGSFGCFTCWANQRLDRCSQQTPSHDGQSHRWTDPWKAQVSVWFWGLAGAGWGGSGPRFSGYDRPGYQTEGLECPVTSPIWVKSSWHAGPWSKGDIVWAANTPDL